MISCGELVMWRALHFTDTGCCVVIDDTCLSQCCCYGYLQYVVEPRVFDNPASIEVEGDASSATYPLALAAISGGTVTVRNVGSASLQGDQYSADD